jgi:hypothetical protein
LRLAHPFIQLPILCDVERLRHEVSEVKPGEWRSHPSKFKGNAGALLVTVGGGQNDDFAQAGQFQATPLLGRLPYVRQIMTALRAPVSRSRFMRLAPGATVPPHDDVGLHWFQRTRVHIPVTTNPRVLFHCADRCVHMVAGQVWVFDNFERHWVENRGDEPRVHLVIDVVPNAAFLELLDRGFRPAGNGQATFRPEKLSFDPASSVEVPFEIHRRQSFSRQEIQGLVRDIAADIPRLGLADRRTRSLRKELDRFERAWSEAGGPPRLEPRVARLLRKLHPVFLGAQGRMKGKDALTVLSGVLFTTNKVSAAVVGRALRLLGPVFVLRVAISTLARIARSRRQLADRTAGPAGVSTTGGTG